MGKDGQPVQFLLRLTAENKRFLEAESEAQGRSQAWLVNHAVELWRNRLERDRAKRSN